MSEDVSPERQTRMFSLLETLKSDYTRRSTLIAIGFTFLAVGMNKTGVSDNKRKTRRLTISMR